MTGQKAAPQNASLRIVSSPVLRYAVALLAFALLLLLALAFRHFSIRFDLSIFIIAALVAIAWYGGAGPGLMFAILFELASIALSNPPTSWARFIFAEVSRTALLVFLVLIVSSRRKAETRLREGRERLLASEQRFSKAFNASPLPMSIVTYGEGRYIDVNDSFLHNSGYTRQEVIGRTTTEVGIYADSAEREKLRQTLQEQGKIHNMEICRRIKSGELRVALMSSEIITLDGQQCVLSTINDITEYKRLEEQLIHAQKMEAIGRLAGGVAHDFNNLLTAIIGYSQIVKSGLKEGDPVGGQIEEIEKAGQRAASLTSQLLAFSRKQVIQPRAFNLNTVISDVTRMLKRLVGEDVELVTALDPQLQSVKADPGQIEQVIMNLAVNARDALPRGGKLTIETANVNLDESYADRHFAVRPGPYVMLAVSDNGVGMDKETQSHIFEPFFTTKEQGKGTGLGLSTVYGIVKQAGGHIWVYSEPGVGTTFKIYLPRVERQAEVRETSVATTGSLRGTETILLVDDDEAVRGLARQVLELNGYAVLEAGDGEEALLVCENHAGPIHLMITDVVMPGMNCQELAIRAKALRREMSVLYMSGYAGNAILHHGVLETDVSFLHKPFTPDALLRKAREVLNE